MITTRSRSITAKTYYYSGRITPAIPKGNYLNNSIAKLTRQRLVVSMKPGAGCDFSGVLIHADRGPNGQYVFADVEAYVPDSTPERLAGEVYVDRVDVAFVQKVPPKVPHANG